MQLDEALGQRESEAGAGRMRRSLVEALERAEDPRVLILWDAEARVDDLELEVVRGRPQVEADPTAGRRELHRVRQEVEQDLADPPGIEIHARAFVGGRFEADVLLAGALARRGEHRREQRPDRERLRPELDASCLDLCEIEHVVDQREEVISGVADISQIALLAVGGRGRELLLEQVGKADDRVERCAQLVAHVREELGLVPVGGVGLLLRGASGLLGRRELEPLRDEPAHGSRQHEREHQEGDDQDDADREDGLHQGAERRVECVRIGDHDHLPVAAWHDRAREQVRLSSERIGRRAEHGGARDNRLDGRIGAQILERVAERIQRVGDESALSVYEQHVRVAPQRGEPLGGAREVERGTEDARRRAVRGDERNGDDGRRWIPLRRAAEGFRHERLPLAGHADEVVTRREVPSEHRGVRWIEREELPGLVFGENDHDLATLPDDRSELADEDGEGPRVARGDRAFGESARGDGGEVAA